MASMLPSPDPSPATALFGSDSESSSSSEGDSSEGEETIRNVADDRSEFVLQIDDEADEDLMAVLLEPQPPDHVDLCNTECLPRMQPQRIVVAQNQNLC